MIVVISDSLFCLCYRVSLVTDQQSCSSQRFWWRQGSQGIYTPSSPRLSHTTHRLSGLQEFWKFAYCIPPYWWISPKLCWNLLETHVHLLEIFLTCLTWEWKELTERFWRQQWAWAGFNPDSPSWLLGIPGLWQWEF